MATGDLALPPAATRPPAVTSTASPSEVSRLIELIRERGGFDLSGYKRNPLGRSIARRAAACHCATIEEYCALAEASDDELGLLLSQITVEYSEFFRDPELFDLLRERLLPELIERKKRAGQPAVRLWSVGCAGGEEAYSLAIVLLEALGGDPDGFDIKLFATDVDAASLARARAGRYRNEELAGLEPQALGRYFRGRRTLVVRSFLRDLVCFGVHNVLTDPPISKLDLIACRNVLIYLEKDAQVHTLRNLCYGLVPGGYLVLGKTEKLRPEVEAAFEPVNEKWRVYRRIEGPTP